MIFLLIVLFLLALTWLIKYPDIITASARIVAVNPPKLISSRSEGKLQRLFAQNEKQVYKGQHLAVIENTSDYDEVMTLQVWVDEILEGTKTSSYEVLNTNLSPAFYNLGELQTEYQTFQNELVEAKQTLTNGFYEKKRSGLMKDLKFLNDLKANTYQ